MKIVAGTREALIAFPLIRGVLCGTTTLRGMNLWELRV
jgi:hypothetical protein